MRRWVLDRQAEADLQAQLDYLIERGAVEAAARLRRASNRSCAISWRFIRAQAFS
jgi:plasmid stabilization system protein ParE